MAALPANNTTRYFLDYSVNGRDHTLPMRVASDVTPAEASTEFDALLTILSPTLKEISVVGMRRQADDSDVSLPVTWSGDASYGTGVATDKDAASYLSFTGRSADGRRNRITVFGAPVPSDDDNFRVPAGDSSLVADALTYLDGAEGVWKTISSQGTFWNQYANTGINAHFRNKYR